MASALTFTWDAQISPAVPARAADLADLGDGAYVDDALYPPIPGEMMTSSDANQFAAQLAGMNRVITAVAISIHFAAGAPGVQQIAAMGSTILPGSVTVTHTGTGIVTLTWPAGTFPPARLPAFAVITVDGAYLQPTALPVSNGVQVKTRNNTATLVDTDFCVWVS